MLSKLIRKLNILIYVTVVSNRSTKLTADPHIQPEKRFVYYLLAATGIVVVPLSGFQSRHAGFRVTILEADDTKRTWTFNTLRESIDQYLTSA